MDCCRMMPLTPADLVVNDGTGAELAADVGGAGTGVWGGGSGAASSPGMATPSSRSCSIS